MDIINMLIQTKKTDIVNRVPEMYEECVQYERLSRSEKFRMFDTPIMRKRFPILASLHNNETWTNEEWRLGVILYETLVALGVTDFFHGQNTLERQLKSTKKQNKIMTTMVTPAFKSIEDAKTADEFIAGITHNDRYVFVTDNTMYIGYESQQMNIQSDDTVIMVDKTLYHITLLPDVWSHGLTIGTVNNTAITLYGEDELMVGDKSIRIENPERFFQQTLRTIISIIHASIKMEVL